MYCGCWVLKFIYSEKATKFWEISTVDLSYVVPVKSTVEISQNFVAFPTYINFTCMYSWTPILDKKKGALYVEFIKMHRQCQFHAPVKGNCNSSKKTMISSYMKHHLTGRSDLCLERWIYFISTVSQNCIGDANFMLRLGANCDMKW